MVGISNHMKLHNYPNYPYTGWFTRSLNPPGNTISMSPPAANSAANSAACPYAALLCFHAIYKLPAKLAFVPYPWDPLGLKSYNIDINIDRYIYIYIYIYMINMFHSGSWFPVICFGVHRKTSFWVVPLGPLGGSSARSTWTL